MTPEQLALIASRIEKAKKQVATNQRIREQEIQFVSLEPWPLAYGLYQIQDDLPALLAYVEELEKHLKEYANESRDRF